MSHDLHPTAAREFDRDTAGLPTARRSELVDLADGDHVELRIAPVVKRIGDTTVRMLAYNGSIPGPTLKVGQGSEIVVDVVNEGDLEATVHWHGLRLENRYDGTHETQTPIPIGGRFTVRVTVPDPGIYWYHPHIRQDYGQELGLYGNVLVVPAEPNYWPPAHRDLFLTLDDILLEDGRVAPFDRDETNYVAMGRFGNVLLVSGETDLALSARRDEVVRLYLTNTANTRVFNVALPGAQMKLVGGDSGRCEHEALVESIPLAPSERVVVDALFDTPGNLTLEHRTPERTSTLATIRVADEPAEPSLGDAFAVLRHNPEWADERQRIDASRATAPDKTLAFVAEMDDVVVDGPVVYGCPMHPEVVSDEPGRCPQCGMKLLATAPVTGYACPMHPHVTSEEPGRCPECGMKLLGTSLTVAGHEAHSGEQPGHHDGHDHDPQGHDGDRDENGDPREHATTKHDHDAGHADGAGHAHGAAGGIEWEDDMVAVNRRTTPANMRWKIVDRSTGAANHAIDWKFRVGDRVRIRLVNEMDSDHPMHHPFHVHGAGRFLILSRDDVPEPNLVWKDTVLVRTGESVDILLEVTHPGRWMAHCHIAEHHESGMMFSFDVTA